MSGRGAPPPHPPPPPASRTPSTQQARLGDEPHLGRHKRVLVVQLDADVEEAAVKRRVPRAWHSGEVIGAAAVSGGWRCEAPGGLEARPGEPSGVFRRSLEPLRQPISFCSESPCTSMLQPLALSRSISRSSFCRQEVKGRAGGRSSRQGGSPGAARGQPRRTCTLPRSIGMADRAAEPTALPPVRCKLVP